VARGDVAAVMAVGAATARCMVIVGGGDSGSVAWPVARSAALSPPQPSASWKWNCYLSTGKVPRRRSRSWRCKGAG